MLNLNSKAQLVCDTLCFSYEMKQFMPSTIAIVSILIARKVMNIYPLWNKSLKNLTFEEFEGEIQKAYALGLAFYFKHFGF